MTSIGEALVQMLQDRGVKTVFGIPGVHVIELYRGLADSGIRHVSARHEQGAGFMADGYARISGAPGVAFVITGPGLSNILTPMAQARADSVPMLVISGVNARDSLGHGPARGVSRGLGRLHELPNQQKMAGAVALTSTQVRSGGELVAALEQAFSTFAHQRGGPVHIEIPIDVMGLPFTSAEGTADRVDPVPPGLQAGIQRAVEILAPAKKPLILAGGGASGSEPGLMALAQRLGAPCVLSVNARGLMHAHPLCVPASPSLGAVRALIGESDAVLALGTELGPTDYDMFGNGGLPDIAGLVRVDICPAQLARHPAEVKICAPVEIALAALRDALAQKTPGAGAPARASATRQAARQELGQERRAQLALLDAMRDTVPGAIVVGDSTQLTYTCNLYFDHDRPPRLVQCRHRIRGAWIFHSCRGRGRNRRSGGGGHLHHRRWRGPVFAARDDDSGR